MFEGNYHWYKNENICNSPYTKCTAVSDSFVWVIWASFYGEAFVAQSLKLSDFAVLGSVAVSATGLSTTPVKKTI